jgi:tripeptide aminopeptidase
MQKPDKSLPDFTNMLVDLAVQIQQIPSPTFEEMQRAEFVSARFTSEKLQDIQIDSAGNVLARFPGKGTSLPLIISAHLDTVFPMGTNLSTRRDGSCLFGPGIGDNSLGVAALFGILWHLREKGFQPENDIWFVANSCEEGLGDLRGMRAVVERFGAEVKAYLVIEGMAFGHIYHRATGVRRYKITCATGGGHAWTDYGKPSAIHELAKLLTQITAIPLTSSPRTTLNAGKIAGGTSINTLAPDAWLELDLRSESSESLTSLIQRVEDLVAAAGKSGVWFDMDQIGERPAGEISLRHPLIRLATSCVQAQGVEPAMTLGSTDANIPLSKGYPALVLGVTTGGGAHTSQEFIDTSSVERGMAHLVEFVKRV